jgi:Skp family chaperone for outer membrane proteins
MLYSQKSIPVVLSFFAAVGLASSAMAADQAPAITAAPKLNIGVVDKDKVVTGYPQAQHAAEDLKRSEDRVHKLIEDSNKQYEEAKASKKPAAELESLQKRLQTSIDKEVKDIQTKAQGLETQLENDIDGAIKAEAAARKCDAVFVKQAVLVGGTDITDGVVKRLGVAKAAATK